MVTLKTISATIKTTRNFWMPFLLKFSHGKRNIVFRNGAKMELNWEEYCSLRDWLERFHDRSFTIQSVKGGYWLKKEDVELSFFTQYLKEALTFFELTLSLTSQGWTFRQINETHFQFQKDRNSYFIHQLDSGLFNVRSDELEMVGPLDSVTVFFGECVKGLYDCDFNNKVVLDVGGFCGETAIFFSSQGAKKVIVYEPVQAHHEFIRKNITLNNIRAELHEEGIGREDGIQIINYGSTNLAFGYLSKGKNQLKVKIKNVADVIEESKADIGKFDCEGAETSLITLSQETLRKISFYIIETHSAEIRKAIMNKFKTAGFKLARDPVELTDDISLLYFEKMP